MDKPFKNIIIHQNSKIAFSKNYSGNALDANTMAVFTAMLQGFGSSLGQDLSFVNIGHDKISFKKLGEYSILLHYDARVGETAAVGIVKEISNLLEFVFGPFEFWNANTFDLKGLSDLFYNFLKVQIDPSNLVGGMSKILIPSAISEQVESLLKTLESSESILSNSTILLLGNSILFSRYRNHDSRMILHLVKAKPLLNTNVRYIPVYHGGAWRNLYIIKLGNYTLGLSTLVEKPFTEIVKQVEDFRLSFTMARLEIPTEEPPVLLRLFANRDTLALFYQNIKTGQTLFPSLRPGPEIQQKEIIEAFYTFFCGHLSLPGTSSYTVTRDGYRYYGLSSGVDRLYVLYAENLPLESLEQKSLEILKGIKNLLF